MLWSKGEEYKEYTRYYCNSHKKLVENFFNMDAIKRAKIEAYFQIFNGIQGPLLLFLAFNLFAVSFLSMGLKPNFAAFKFPHNKLRNRLTKVNVSKLVSIRPRQAL